MRAGVDRRRNGKTNKENEGAAEAGREAGEEEVNVRL